jgi:pimeloyl-ACP methyl ester carboxylesterase
MSKFLIVLFVAILILPQTTSALVKKVGEATVTDVRDYPIIFIHGAAGSELEVAGNNLWPAYAGGLVNDSPALQLALNSDGKTDCCGIVTAPRVLRYASGYDSIGAGLVGIYAGFYDYMDAAGYAFEQPKEDGKVFYDFVYDWRKDNRDWTRALDLKVNLVLKETKADKVILIGHSMGGLQARLYMKDAKRAAKVASVIFIGTPHHGAPQVYWAYTEGYNFGNPKIGINRMWEVMKNWPAGYQLLPDYPAVQDESGKFWTLKQMYAIPDFYSEQEYQHTLDSATGRNATYHPTAGLPNHRLAEDQLAFHQNLGNSVDKYPWVKYFHIAGGGQTTLQYVRAKREIRPGFDLPVLVLERVESKNGDGTVAAAGAKIDGVDEYVTVTGEHAALPGLPAVTAHVTRYREQVNNETFRFGIADLIKTYAEGELSTLAGYKKAGSAQTQSKAQGDLIESIFRLLFTGQPDKEKIKLRDELRDRAVHAFENALVNVHISAEGAQEADTMYLVIKNFQVVESGHGEISPATVDVNVDSYTTLRALAHHEISAKNAYQSGKATFSGAGAIEGLKSKILQWVVRYGFGKN